jgi:PAS domain S-box-containing protein
MKLNKSKIEKLILEYNTAKINLQEEDGTSYVVSLQDVTEKVIIEEAITQSEKRFKALVQHGADLTAIVSPDGTYLYVSPNYPTILGLSEEELIGKNAFDFFHPEDLDKIKTEFSKLSTEKRIKSSVYRFKNKFTGWSWIQSTGTNLLNDDTVRGIVINSIEVTDLIEAQQALNKSNERFEMIMRAGSESIWDYDIKQDEIFLSNGFYENFGIISKNPKQNNNLINSLIHPKDKMRMIRSFRKTLKDVSKNEWTLNYRLLKSSGDYAYIVDKAVILRDENGIAFRVVGAIKDITSEYFYQELEKIEKEIMEFSMSNQVKLKEVLELYSKKLEVLFPDMLASILEVKKGKLKNLASPSLPKDYIRIINGIEIGENEGSCGTAAFLKQRVIVSDIETDIRWAKYKELAITYGFKACWSQPIFNKDNEVVATFANYYKTIRMPSKYEEQAFERSQRLLSIIIEKFEYLKDIKKSNERYELINKASRDAIYEWDIQNDIFYWSDSFKTIFGHNFKNDSFSLQNWVDLMHPDDDEKFKNLWDSFLFDPNHNFWVKEFRFKKADETFAYVEENGHIIRDKTGMPIRMVGVLRDISQVKLMAIQKELLSDISKFFKDDKKLKDILSAVLKHLITIDNFSIAEIWLTNSNKKELNLVSKYAKANQANGFYSKENLKLKVKIDEGLPGKTFQSKKVQVWDEIKKTKTFVRKEAAKNTNLTSAIGLPIYHNSKVIGVLILMSDLSAFRVENNIEKFTELQNYLGAEIKRKQKEEEMFLLFESAPEIMAIASPSGYFTKVNPALCKLLGRSEEEITHVSFETFIHPNDIINTQAEYEETITGERRASNFINRYQTKSGNYRWISWSSSEVFDDEGNVFAYGRDVTELIELQHLLENASKLAKVGGWEIDVINQKLHWSPMTKLIAEVEEDFQPEMESVLQFYREDYRELVSTSIFEAIKTGKSFDIEAIIITQNKSQKWVRAIGNAEFGNGECIRLFGSFQDISERKIAQLQLERKNSYQLSVTKIILELMNSADIDITLENIFNIMGKTVNVDRIYFFEIDENLINGLMSCSQRVEWTNEGITTEINNPLLQNLVLEEYQEYFLLLEKAEVISEITSKLPPSKLKTTMESQGVKSFLFFPMFVFNKFYGFLGFDDCTSERVWSNEEVSFLSNITYHLSANIQSRLADLEQKNILKEKNNILESIGDGFYALDANWIITYWNKQAEVTLNKKREDVVGKNLWEVYEDAKELKFHSEYHRAKETQQSVTFDEYYPTSNLWFEVSAYPTKEGLSVYFKDVSIKKISEQKIKETNERFEKVTEATNDAIWDYNFEEKVLFWSKGFSTLFQYDLNNFEPTFDFLLSCIHPDDRNNFIEKIEQFLFDSSKNNWFEEYRFLKADGTYAYVMDRAIFIRNNQGRATRAIGAMTDITYRKEYENSLTSLNKILKKQADDLAFSNKELEQFAYVASHDLQEPLRMVTNFLSQLEKKYKDQLDERAEMYIHYAVDGAKRMRQIILDILEFSRIGKIDESMDFIDLEQIVNEVVLFQNEIIKEKNATILIDKLPVIFNHKTPLKQVFQNLISNALKYAKADESPLIEIRAKELENEWQFSVKDNGIGINGEYFDKIFEIFQRLHVREDYSGTGIGLSIVKKILENMGGKIWVESNEGQGSIFSFIIPKNYSNE